MGSTIGGQAVPEGVMLRGPAGWALAVRRTDGAIAVFAQRFRRPPRRVASRPFVRGLAAIAGALPLGVRSLALADTLRHPTPPPPPTLRARVWGTISLVVALALAVGLFGVLPATLASAIDAGGALGHAVEPTLRTIAIVGYIAAIGLLPDVRRVFAYHGAEHQVVTAHEEVAGGDTRRRGDTKVSTTVARRHSRFHPRCGTTFVLLVAITEGLVHALGVLPSSALARLVEVPVAIMVAYEVLYLATAHRDRWWARVVLAPGRALQRLTTRAPDEHQLEVGCAALHALLQLEGSEDQDQQQDDQDQRDESATDVHVGSSSAAPVAVPA